MSNSYVEHSKSILLEKKKISIINLFIPLLQIAKHSYYFPAFHLMSRENV